MSKNKKLSKQEKYLRRLNEAKKASSKVDTRVVLKDSNSDANFSNTVVKSSMDAINVGRYELPIKEIKKDLFKNLIFVIFSVVLIIGLKITGFGFDQVKHLMNL